MYANETQAFKELPVVIAQITDCHLFADKSGLHFGQNVYANLTKVLLEIADNSSINCLFFTGDLSQDHSEKSYQNFADCVDECGITLPVYYLAGNHDDPVLMAKYLSGTPFQANKTINLQNWQIQLVDSKTQTPSGLVSEQALSTLKNAIAEDKHQLLMMHHHPIDVGYFIDKHGLQNKDEFWQVLDQYSNIKGIACGHVHNAMTLTSSTRQAVTLHTCPATSVQFDPNIKGVGILAQGPAYQLFTLYFEGKLVNDVVQLAFVEN
ncbi:metallophosphoesterase [Colwellia echini]|uniref:3',5'-cyclic-nucleotide phosphodiesterase n=1 Tax=Colwellia echini TaxID=1982103 RepID=A0ABY3N1T4_9GAMM|nr:metallophosphoesterase [Colwellia echini]TYK67430.1 3',5'-cyclic-nucleotide phosphodiesterase [Colwellia echini]